MPEIVEDYSIRIFTGKKPTETSMINTFNIHKHDY